jgi:hypothetical protein
MQVGGTALINTDYSATPSLSSVGSGVHWITLPAGQLSLTVTLTPSPDNRLEGDETIDLDLLAPQLANHDYIVSEPSGGVATIADDIAEVTLTIDDGAAAELEEDPGSLTIARSNHGNTTANLRVYLQVGGTAQFNTDYSVSPTLSTASAGVYFTTIPANQLSLTLTLTPDFDFSPEADESVTFGLIAGQLAGHDYLVGAPAAGQITILNHLEGIFADGFEGLLP